MKSNIKQVRFTLDGKDIALRFGTQKEAETDIMLIEYLRKLGRIKRLSYYGKV